MKKLIIISPVLFAMNLSGQNLILNNLSTNNINPQRAIQNQQVFASNMMVNDNNSNSNQRIQTRRNTANSSTQVQTNINISNIDIQLQGNFSQPVNDNLGNSFGNENNMIEQIASANIPAIQVGTGSLNLNLEMPTIKLPSIKFSSRKSVSTSKHKSFYFKNKMIKLNRRLKGKFSLRKKLKIKVDNCFKW